MKINYTEIISSLALVASILALSISYLQYSSNFISPDLKWKLEEFQIKRTSKSSFLLSSDLTFALTNNSSKPIFITGCKFEVDNAFEGRGSWEPEWVDCTSIRKLINSEGVLELKAGQSRFFNEVFSLEIPNGITIKLNNFTDSDLDNALERMGIKMNPEYKNALVRGNNSCSISFYLRPASKGYGSNCGLEQDTKFFTLSVQIGSEQSVKKEIRLTYNQDWPWQTIVN